MARPLSVCYEDAKMGTYSLHATTETNIVEMQKLAQHSPWCEDDAQIFSS